jgi:hypothetical protein
MNGILQNKGENKMINNYDDHGASKSQLREALKKCYLVIKRLNEWDSAIEDAYQSARVALNLDTPPKIDEDRKQDDVEHSWEAYHAAREAHKEMLSDDPDENALWGEEEAEDRQRERDRQDETNFKRGVDY